MRPIRSSLSAAFAVAAVLIPCGESQAAPTQAPQTLVPQEPSVAAAFQTLPLAFEPNVGQAPDGVGFVARGSGCQLSVASDGFALKLVRERPVRPADRSRKGATDAAPTASATIAVRFAGADPAAPVTGEGVLQGKSNYLLGSDPANWRTDVPNFAKARISGAYPGVDVVMYGRARRFEYDFEVAPGACPDAIRLDIVGASRLDVEADGALAMCLPDGSSIRMLAPVAYQNLDGGRREIAAAYHILAGNRVGFTLGDYDRGLPLVIDPILSYSSYIGGTGTDAGYGIARDTSGRLYITGATTGGFPTTGSAYEDTYQGGDTDVFVLKLNPAVGGAAGVVYSTYIGGGGADAGHSIAVDGSGNAYVGGETSGLGFPVSKIHGSVSMKDGFILRLNSSGSLLNYSARIGGIFDDYVNAIGLDASLNVFATGVTASPDFPKLDAYQQLYGGFGDAFVLRLQAGGNSLKFSTYLGGSQADEGLGLTVDPGNARVYVCGDTASTNFPTDDAYQPANAGGLRDAFLSVLSDNGQNLSFSTYFGGKEPLACLCTEDVATGVALDADRNVYLTGYTSSRDFPVQQPLYGTYLGGDSDAFLAKFNASGSTLLFSTYLGGGNADAALAMTVDGSGHAIIGGTTASSGLPLVNETQGYAGNGDGFLAKFSTGGSALLYSTCIGGAEDAEVVYSVAADADGNAFATGSTESDNFPTAGSPADNALGGSQDAFIVQLSPSMGVFRDNQFPNGNGWSSFGYNIPGFASTAYNYGTTAYVSTIGADATRFRVAGVISNSSEWLPYTAIGPDRIARGKFFVYATGQANPNALNTIPNMRMRLANRFAATSMQEVFNHLNIDPANQALSQELRPSSDPAKPSLYRVDYDPVDVPYLVANPGTEGVQRAFEAFSTDPQDNGSLGLTECIIGTYPADLLTGAGGQARDYTTIAGTAGALSMGRTGATSQLQTVVPGTQPGEFPQPAPPQIPVPTLSEGGFGLRLNSAAVPPTHIGTASVDFSAGTDRRQFVRVMPGKQYLIRYHLVSTQQSYLNAQVRMRARSVKFAWVHKFEIGGANGAGVENNALAQGMLPGIGCQNPDTDGNENGGWYSLLFQSPLNEDIRPESFGPIAYRMPNIASQPGPGVNSDSRRDLRVGLDLLDTLSTGAGSELEAGDVTVDRIEVTEYDQVDD